MSDLREALGHAAGPPPPPLDVRAVQARVAQRSNRRRVLSAAAVALPAVGLGAVIALGQGPDVREGDVLVPVPPAASAPQTPAPSVEPSPPVLPTTVPTPESQPSEPPVQYTAPPPELAYDSGDAAFRTPSGNIFCYLTSGQAACGIRERTWTPPPRPADCDETNDYADHVSVESGPAAFSCGTDTPVDPNAGVLPYGQGLVIDAWRCASERSGVTCENTQTGHGFTLNRATYRLF